MSSDHRYVRQFSAACAFAVVEVVRLDVGFWMRTVRTSAHWNTACLVVVQDVKFQAGVRKEDTQDTGFMLCSVVIAVGQVLRPDAV